MMLLNLLYIAPVFCQGKTFDMTRDGRSQCINGLCEHEKYKNGEYKKSASHRDHDDILDMTANGRYRDLPHDDICEGPDCVKPLPPVRQKHMIEENDDEALETQE